VGELDLFHNYLGLHRQAFTRTENRTGEPGVFDCACETVMKKTERIKEEKIE